MLKAAVIGVGSMGNHHARIYRDMPGVELCCVVDANPETAAKVGTRYMVPYYSDINEMLDNCCPDLVSLAVPTSLHFEIGSLLINRGVHLLIEKPIARTVEEGAKLNELAASKGVILAVGHIERFNPVIMELNRRLKSGMAGRIYKIHTQRLSPYPPRIQDAGVIIDLASHDIDLMRYLMQDEITRVYGEVHHSINTEREDMFNGLMRFKSGAVGVLDVNWITPTKMRNLTVTGARGMFVCNLLSQELTFYENGDGSDQWDTLSILHGVSEGNVLGIRIRRHEPLDAELNDFVSAVRDNHQPTVTGQEGLETLILATEFLRASSDIEIVTKGSYQLA